MLKVAAREATGTKESCAINKSLSALSGVILALNEERSYVPYRDSKLTLLLRDSIGGSTRTWMVANVSPLERCMTETLSTIMYAQRGGGSNIHPRVPLYPLSPRVHFACVLPRRFAARAAKVKNRVVRQAVKLMEDDDGNIHLRNLSAHAAMTEEDALNLLFLGDTNRTTSETPMNLASSRSHCIFTIFLTASKVRAPRPPAPRSGRAPR